MNRKLLLLLLPIILILLIPRAQAQVYFQPPEETIQGGAAFVPGFHFNLDFPYVAGGQGFACPWSRTYAYNASDNITGCIAKSNGVNFQTDSVDIFHIRVIINYTEPVNQTAHLVIYSAGSVVDDRPIIVLGDHINIPITVNTQLAPHWPTALELKQAENQIGCNDIQSCREQVAATNDHFSYSDQIAEISLGCNAATAIVVAAYVATRRRESTMGG